MQPIHTPAINVRYWLAILFASILGTNLGDLYAHDSGLGIGTGLVVLAALAAGVFALERRSALQTETFYWLVIVIIRTGATNIADFLSFRAHIKSVPLPLWMLLWVVFFGVVVALSGRLTAWIEDGAAQQRLRARAPFWTAMLGAGILGTILGDVLSHALGGSLASVLLLAIFIAALALRQRFVASILGFWLVVALARTAGTAIGDWLAEDALLDLGLPMASLISGISFTAIVALKRPSRTPAAVSLP